MESTRDKIVRESATLFNQKGFFGTSMSDILEATGLKKGGVYNHFKSKDEIALAAFDFAFEKMFRRFRKRLDECTTAYEKLIAVIEVFASLDSDPVVPGGCPVANTGIQAVDTHPQLRERALEAIESLRKYIEIKIVQAQAEGSIKASVKAEEAAQFILCGMEGALMYSRIRTGGEVMKKQEELMKFYIGSLKVESYEN